jgi:hypothetical protein
MCSARFLEAVYVPPVRPATVLSMFMLSHSFHIFVYYFNGVK